jgi:hypothetical protein
LVPSPLAVLLQGRGHLDGQFAGGGEDERLHAVLLPVKPVQQGQAVGRGLAGAGLRLADHVAAGQQSAG